MRHKGHCVEEGGASLEGSSGVLSTSEMSGVFSTLRDNPFSTMRPDASLQPEGNSCTLNFQQMTRRRTYFVLLWNGQGYLEGEDWIFPGHVWRRKRHVEGKSKQQDVDDTGA